MIEIKGKYNTAKCFTDYLDDGAYKQIMTMCNTFSLKDEKIRIMPDVHAGEGCTIGTTMTIKDKIIPSFVGVDIGCGMYTVCLGKADIDFEKLDRIIHSIPNGKDIWEEEIDNDFQFKKLRCFDKLKRLDRLKQSLATLGGGNHFIEVDIDEDGNKYLIIHSGSRNLGVQVANIYQNIARDLNLEIDKYQMMRLEIIKVYKEIGRKCEIQGKLNDLAMEWKNKKLTILYELCHLYGKDMEDYLYDVNLCQEFAKLNREKIACIITKKMGFEVVSCFHTIHNYIDVNEMILRKGSISAKLKEKVLIPINMKDGSLICEGKGNEDWNTSAPHGAGRLMSRSVATSTLKLEDYQKAMEGIYSTCVNEKTLDESPMAYKSIDEIIKNIFPTVKILKRLKPIYNFKACELN